MLKQRKKDKLQNAAQILFAHLGDQMECNFGVQLWDGTFIPLGSKVNARYFITITDPGVLGCIMRRPTLESLLIQFVTGGISYHGGDLVTFLQHAFQAENPLDLLSPEALKNRVDRRLLLRHGLPLLFASRATGEVCRFRGDDTGRKLRKRDEKRFIQFHYDLSNAFYQLFLDPEMVYSCGYFQDWDTPLEQAQLDKLEMICRKLRLQPGERLLDIGCGWGGLLCYAARHYDIQGHGVTLSRQQFTYATEKVKRLGLEGQVRIELRNYEKLEGQYDKIASIGMYEHVSIPLYPRYFTKMASLLKPRGIFLNHGITRPALASDREFKKITPGRRIILKYVFPGSELDHIGHTLQVMERSGFEIHDVESWREHYGLTTRHWCRRLEANRDKAVDLVGEERFRMWLVYLAGVSFSFFDGSLGVYQTVATKKEGTGRSGMPLTRKDLYRRPTGV